MHYIIVFPFRQHHAAAAGHHHAAAAGHHHAAAAARFQSLDSRLRSLDSRLLLPGGGGGPRLNAAFDPRLGPLPPRPHPDTRHAADGQEHVSSAAANPRLSLAQDLSRLGPPPEAAAATTAANSRLAAIDPISAAAAARGVPPDPRLVPTKLDSRHEPLSPDPRLAAGLVDPRLAVAAPDARLAVIGPRLALEAASNRNDPRYLLI